MSSPQVVNSYLAQLESALRGVDPVVRDEIVAGIREELDGLDAAGAAARIEGFGDPEFIAAEARAASPAPVAQPTIPPAAAMRTSNAFPIVVAFLVMSGGLIFPLVGGVIGLALVCVSRAWTRTEKIVAVLVPVAGVGLDIVVSLIESVTVRNQTRFEGPSMSDFAPDFGLHGSILIVLGLFIVDGIWLLWRVLRRR